MTAQTIQIGDCARIVNGFAFKSELFTTIRKGLPVIRIRDVVRGHSDTFFTGDYPPAALVNNGDLLVGMDGEFNIGCWRGGAALLNQRVCKIEPKEGVSDISYLRHALGTLLRRIEDRTPFATVKHLSSEELKEESIPLPNLVEQQRIAGHLEKVDRLRRIRSCALQAYDELVPAAFLEMFGDPVRNTKDFSVSELEELASVERGKFTPRPRNDPSYYGGKFPFIQTGDITDSGGRLRSWTQTLNEKGAGVSRSFPPGTIVIAIVGATIGKTAILEVEVFCPDSVVGVQVDPERTTKEYIEFVLRLWRPTFLAQAPETARANINLDTLRPLRIPVPPLRLQQEFSALVDRHERVRSVQLEALRQADHLFKTLLHHAFSPQ
jgi:type I restriction enzyme, S subunit